MSILVGNAGQKVMRSDILRKYYGLSPINDKEKPMVIIDTFEADTQEVLDYLAELSLAELEFIHVCSDCAIKERKRSKEIRDDYFSQFYQAYDLTSEELVKERLYYLNKSDRIEDKEELYFLRTWYEGELLRGMYKE